MGNTKYLVIVESPAKARTLTKFLSNDYTVKSSFGHIRDLPKNNLGFDPNNKFKPEYIISPDKRKIVNELKKLISKDTVIYLASDEDREGESISWHLIDTLGLQNHTKKRIVFHEITKPAILHAIEHPRELNMNMVDAQQARRILDRAVGYKLSPLLWKKVKFGLSAGRVQSVAVRIVVDREKEIEKFIPDEFWKIKLDVLTEPSFKAELNKVDGKVTKITNKQDAENIKYNCDNDNYILDEIEEKESFRTPPPPFTTSTLQQDASSRLGMSPKVTMMIAQKLYEGSIDIPGHTGGIITYMRTDSLNLSDIALNDAKAVIRSEYGNEYVLNTPRRYNAKGSKVAAQEAHEAIRPVNLNLKPSDIKKHLDPKEYKLYLLIWQRTIATQMEQARLANTTYKILGGDSKQYEFVAKGTRILSPGFMLAYTEGTEDSDSVLDSKEKFLPKVEKGTVFNKTILTTEQNFTKPLPRYTEASLIKKMETEGIGRPSTYASTLATIIAREYVVINPEKKLVPTVIGTVVTDYLIQNFPNIVDLAFTANIETEFDKIANGGIIWSDVMQNFYFDFVKNIELKEGTDRVQYSETKLLGIDPESGKDIFVKSGQHGLYIQVGIKEEGSKVKPKVSPVPKDLTINEITLDVALELIKIPRTLGDYNNSKVIVNIGRFGPYIQVDKKYYSIPNDDPYSISFTRAIDIIKEKDDLDSKSLIWFSYDNKLGKLEIINGKYGFYLRKTDTDGKTKTNFKIPKTFSEQELKNISLDKVLEIINNSPSTKDKKFKKKYNSK